MILARQYYEARPSCVAADKRQSSLTSVGPLRIVCWPCIQCILISSLLSQLLSHPWGYFFVPAETEGTHRYSLG